MQQGGKASVTLFRYDLFRFISLLYNGSARIELLVYTFVLSTRRSIRLLRFCLAFRTVARLSENRFEAYSSSSAYLDTIGRYSM